MAFPFVPTIATLGGLTIVSAIWNAPSSTGALPRVLRPFRWYRLRLKTAPVAGSPPIPRAGSRVVIFDIFEPNSFIPFIVGDRVRALGFEDPIFAMGDAQNGTTWDVFTRFRGGGPSDLTAAGILRADEVLNTNPHAPSPRILPWIGPFKRRVSNDPTSDGPMNSDLLAAASFAATHDDNEERLENFATTLLPEFPSVAGILRGRRRALALARADRYSIAPVLALREPTRQPTLVAGFWDIAAAVLTGGGSIIIPAIIETISDAIDWIADVGRTVLDVIKTAAPFIQMGLSFIPGIGTVASAALGAGIALAEGRPITDALIEAARGAFPGGPIAARAVETAIRTVINLAEGQSLDVAAMDGLRGSLSQTEKMAFDAAVALAQGKKIQDVATIAVGAISPEASTVLTAISDGRPLNAQLLAQVAAARAGLPPSAQAALGAVTNLAQGGDLSETAANAARARLPPDARPAFDAAWAISQKQDPRQAVIARSRNMAPDTPESRAAMTMTSQALRGAVTPATLIGEAARFIPNAPEGIRGNPPPQAVTPAEAQRISDMGTKAFAHPVLYLPNGARRDLEEQAQRDAIRLEVEIQQEQARVAALLATPGAQRAVEWLRELFRLGAQKQALINQQNEARVAAYRASIIEAARLHAAYQASWIPIYDKLMLKANLGGFQPF